MVEPLAEEDTDLETNVTRGFHRGGLCGESGLHRSLEAVGFPLENRRRAAAREGALVCDHYEVASLGAEAWRVAPVPSAIRANKKAFQDNCIHHETIVRRALEVGDDSLGFAEVFHLQLGDSLLREGGVGGHVRSTRGSAPLEAADG